MDQPTLPPSTTGSADDGAGGERIPGVLLLFSGGTSASARVMHITRAPLELGRGDPGGGAGKIDDGRVSRRHALVAFDGARFVVTDLGSQNGTLVEGEIALAHTPTPAQRAIRIGDSLLVPCADVRPFERWGVRSVDGFVRGPAMQALLDEVVRAAKSGATLHIRGETGTGKEGVAQAFHRASANAGGALVAVNCAARHR